MSQKLLKKCEDHIIHLSQELEAEKNRSFQFEKELKLYQREASIKLAESENSVHELTWLSNENSILKEKLEQSEKKIEQLNQEIKDLKSFLEEEKLENSRNRTEIERIEEYAEDLLEIILKKEQTLEAWNQTGKEVDLKLHSLGTDKAQLKYSLDLYIKKSEELILHNQELALICSNKNEEINNEWEEIKKLTFKLQEAEIREKSFERAILDREEALEKVEESKEEKDIKIAKLLRENEKLEGKIRKFHKDSFTDNSELKEELKEHKKKEEMLTKEIRVLTSELERVCENYKKLEESSNILITKHNSLKAHSGLKSKEYNQLLENFENVKHNQTNLQAGYSQKLEKLQSSIGNLQEDFEEKLKKKEKEHEKEMEIIRINHSNELEASRKLASKFELENSSLSHQLKLKEEEFLNLTWEKMYSPRNEEEVIPKEEIENIKEELAIKDKEILDLKVAFEGKLKKRIYEFSVKTSDWKEKLRERLQACEGFTDEQENNLISDLKSIIQSIN